MQFSLRSFAKINLSLRIISKRDDGFHKICTLFQTVSLHDTVSFATSDTIELTCDDPRIPTGDENLIIKAANTLRHRFNIDAGARIHLEKRIPSPGGLGGGSSNAAVTLNALRRLWELDIDAATLQGIAAGIGSDVPFFLHGGTCLGTGRGEDIEPLDDIDEPFVLIVTPEIAVSTATEFARLNAPTLTKEARNHILSVCRNEAESLNLRHSALINDFEASVFGAYPEIKRVKDALLELGAVNAAMSGSGASVFAIFDKKETRQAAQKALDVIDVATTWRKFAVSTISREQYRREAFGI